MPASLRNAVSGMTQRLHLVRQAWRHPRRLPADQIVGVDQPLILISQIQRSGGTLLSQLFDGTPEIHTYPFELYWGRPSKWNWPNVEGLPCKEAWAYLRNGDLSFLAAFARHGYAKHGAVNGPITHPFAFNVFEQKRLFRAQVAQGAGQRAVLNAFLTSFFNAWIDYRNLQTPKRYVVAFTPRLNMFADSVDRFFRDYPDGHLISLVRHPADWYASAKRHSPEYSIAARSLQEWAASTHATAQASVRYPGRVIALTFEDLVLNTERIVRRVCSELGLTFSPRLLVPTFNGQPVYSDSSFEPALGVDKATVGRRRYLTEADRRVCDQYIPQYEEFRARVGV